MPLQHYPELETVLSWSFPELSGKSVLDVGCGQGAVGYLLRRLPGGSTAHIVGVDCWPEYTNFCRRYGFYDELVTADIRNFEVERQFDIVVAVEVLEHLKREDGLSVLDRLEGSTRELIIVSTPNGPDYREPVGGVPSEAHLSSWRVQDFRRRGYSVRGLGCRWARRESATSRWQVALWYGLTPIALKWPVMADTILAVKTP